ncbi:TrbC family F-type conjugative pilus assembly protein [Candidatus Manganitrophus noduliformans]|uniref:Type-F conjugative transfer system pilin assembly protein TrbC n=1 Tax=Candidatus Manganitrophus noduliformans TaxID=2606439 RepID=A0A7X6DMW5_9BACT|nr:type-F conjugative transfer system pilin assembly protein TrbC [Candidatus Manganitrophus noduliformans]NKE70168.1 hypothetical protein [Candidatus Manganitrophus noduliformans]
MRHKSETIKHGWRSRCRKRAAVFIIFISITVGFAAIKGHTESGKKKVFIQKPTSCHLIEKVEGEKVYLKSQGAACEEELNPISIEMDAALKRVRIFVDGAFWQEQEIVDLDAIRGVIDKSKEMEKTLRVPESVTDLREVVGGKHENHKEQGRAEAERLARHFASEEFRKKLQRESERIKTEVFGIPAMKSEGEAPSGEEETEQADQKSGVLSSSERIYLFVSSSMPLVTLRNYAADLARLSDPNITMVMRGFVGGMKYAQPTLRLVSDIIVKDPGCKAIERRCDAHKVNINVDPLLYRRYQIRQVPALVYLPSLHETELGGSEGLGEASPYYVLYGDASLAYGIERIQREAKSRSLKNLLFKLNP